MKELRFGAVYGAPPFFDPEIDTMGYVEPTELELPSSLVHAIDIWNQEFQSTFFDSYPPDSGFSSREEMEWHNLRGEELADQIQHALGSDRSIRFIPLDHCKTG